MIEYNIIILIKGAKQTFNHNQKEYQMKKSLLTLILLFLTLNLVIAQGKIFPAADASKLFGEVSIEKKVSVSDFKTYLSKTDKYLMVGLVNGEAHFLGDDRKALTAISEKLDSKTVVHKFSKTVVEEFLSKTINLGVQTILLQQRGDNLILSNGVDALDYAQQCPPFCS